MFQQLLEKVRAKFTSGMATDGRPKLLDPIEDLARHYRELLRLAAQIESHAEKAPYPHVARQLRQIAAEKREVANLLRGKIAEAARSPALDPAAIRAGKNHWARMAQDLKDHRSLEEDLSQLAGLLAEPHPETSRILRDIVAAQAPHKDRLLDLIAKADPQAHQF